MVFGWMDECFVLFNKELMNIFLGVGNINNNIISFFFY